MLINEATISLSKVLTLPNTTDLNKAYIKIMLDEDIPVLCINQKEQKQKLIPFKLLAAKNELFWQKKGRWEFFVTGYGLNKLEERARAITGSWNFRKKDEGKAESVDNISGDEKAFGKDYKSLAEMPKEKKIELLKKKNTALNTLVENKVKDHVVVADAITSSTNDTAIINHAVLKEIAEYADDKAKAFSKDVVIYTSDIVRSSAQLLSENIFSDELMRTIARESKGTVLQHIIRVYLNGVAFLSYFNDIVASSSTVMKIRTSFNLKYRKFYQALLPHIDSYDLTLDQVFLGSLRVIPPDMFFKWSVGFLIHDIGKAADIQYHEGEEAYDRERAIEHVMVGFESVMKKTNYPREAGLIVGYHHEYYGDPEGYGPFRSYLQQYKNSNPDAKQNYCITYELEPILDYQALGYFPAKVLEIIDVYDSLIDPRRVYRQALSHDEALDVMYKEFIIKRRKIDPILFDIFTRFIREKEKESTKGSK